jgi:hypothetical protein
MPYDWPEETDFASWELDVLDRKCPTCGRMGTSQQRYVKFRGASQASSGPLDHCTVTQSFVCETHGNDRFHRRFSVS